MLGTKQFAEDLKFVQKNRPKTGKDGRREEDGQFT